MTSFVAVFMLIIDDTEGHTYIRLLSIDKSQLTDFNVTARSRIAAFVFGVFHSHMLVSGKELGWIEIRLLQLTSHNPHPPFTHPTTSCAIMDCVISAGDFKLPHGVFELSRQL